MGLLTAGERLSMMAGRTDGLILPDGSEVAVVWQRSSIDGDGLRGPRTSVQGLPSTLGDLRVGDAVLHATTLARYRVEDIVAESGAGASVLLHLQEEDL